MEQFIAIIASLFLGYLQGRRSKLKKFKKIIINLESQIQNENKINIHKVDTCPPKQPDEK